MAQRKKGREGRAKKETTIEDDGSSLVAVPLNAEEIRQREDERHNFLVKLYSLEEKKKAQVTKINEEIKLCKQESRRLTREIDDREAFVDRQVAMDYGPEFAQKGGRREGAAAAKAAELDGTVANDAEATPESVNDTEEASA